MKKTITLYEGILKEIRMTQNYYYLYLATHSTRMKEEEVICDVIFISLNSYIYYCQDT